MKYDYTGKTYHQLTGIRKADRQDKKGQSIWLWQCSCGNQKELTATHVTRPRFPTKSCGCLGDSKIKYRGFQAFQYAVYSAGNYTDGDISCEEFIELSQQPCHYCGRAVEVSGNYIKSRCGKYEWRYHGLDRMDPCLRHMKFNCVPCCWLCNDMKKAQNYREFLAHIETISLNHRK